MLFCRSRRVGSTTFSSPFFDRPPFPSLSVSFQPQFLFSQAFQGPEFLSSAAKCTQLSHWKPCRLSSLHVPVSAIWLRKNRQTPLKKSIHWEHPLSFPSHRFATTSGRLTICTTNILWLAYCIRLLLQRPALSLHIPSHSALAARSCKEQILLSLPIPICSQGNAVFRAVPQCSLRAKGKGPSAHETSTAKYSLKNPYRNYVKLRNAVVVHFVKRGLFVRCSIE